jgi:hypothetical protein
VLLGELCAERGRVGDPEDVPQELLLAHGALVCTGVDLAREVLAERPDAGELAAGDLAPQLAEAALVVGCERARRDTARRRLDRRGGSRQHQRGAECGGDGDEPVQRARLHFR